MKTVSEVLDESISRHEFEIRREEIPDLIRHDIEMYFPGNYSAEVTEVERGYRLFLKFPTGEDETEFRLKYIVR